MDTTLSPTLRKQVNRAIGILKKGGVVAYPTDTVYGLGACMTSLPAVERIFEIKGRHKGMALPLLVADREQIKQIAVSIPPTAWRLACNFLPGALTLVLLKSPAVPDIITGGGKTIAVRIPDHPVPLALLRQLGEPIIGTSANFSGKPPALTAEEVKSQLGDKVDMVIDGGRCPGGVESTVLDLTKKKPTVLRLGAVSLEQLQRTDPDIMLATEVKNAHRHR
ncbi:MAG: L-threonylcarbamoyladenylate synthase [Dehalococcoidia bacterium]|nr:L-threonylcarbamoyladenylate synthase [Dehalococcoidia bacterium]